MPKNVFLISALRVGERGGRILAKPFLSGGKVLKANPYTKIRDLIFIRFASEWKHAFMYLHL